MSSNWVFNFPPFELVHNHQPVQFKQWDAHLSYSETSDLAPALSWHRRDDDGAYPTPHAHKEAVELAVGEKDEGITIQLAPGPNAPATAPRVELHFAAEPELTCRGRLTHPGSQPLYLEKLEIDIGELHIGPDDQPLTVFKQGYQSWSETRAFLPGERELDSILPVMMTLQSNRRNPPAAQPGAFTSEMFSILGKDRLYVLVGQSQKFDLFFYVNAVAAPRPSLRLVYDFGGKALAPGTQLELDPFVILVDTHANRVQDRYLALIEPPAAATPKKQPAGWCSWYYYFAKVTQADILDNLKAGTPFFTTPAAKNTETTPRYFVLDDGYQTAVGDWLSINAKFPDGLKAISAACEQAGLVPGIWIAPFIARGNSRLFAQHPDWFLKDSHGRPALAGWNPNWGLEGRFYGLDTTHPGFQAYLREVITTFVHPWGFRYLKLDFTYAAALYGQAHDRRLSPAERLKLGYRLVRAAAGQDVFLLGCGSPLSPAIGLVDAMRIGPDVAPYWFDATRYHLTQDPHALCTRFAIRSTLNRAQLHRRLWLNDPDCLLLRASDTQLSPDERRALLNAIIISGGAFFLSDRLADLGAQTWETIAAAQALAAECDRGQTWTLDYLESPDPGLVYNSAGYLAAFNLGERPLARRVDLKRYLEGAAALRTAQEVWSGQPVRLVDGVLDLDELPPHASYLFKL